MIVFPSTNSSDPKEKIITEYNICNIVNRLVDREAFVISAVNTGSELAITFNISGYIFSTADIWGEAEAWGKTEAGEPYTPIRSSKVYASLLTEKSTASSYWDTFKSIKLTNDNPYTDPNVVAYLQLWDGSQVPRDSWIKFNNNSVYIDDGDLDP